MMELRDEFALTVMKALAASIAPMHYQKDHGEIIGAISYGVADAMMKARAPNETVAQIGIEELALSVRTSNCLRAEGIFFVGDLVKLTRSQVVRIPGLGKRSREEVFNALAARGLSLGVMA